jgi:CMP-N,N'-diacetyllegionaminic acid synthase
LHALQELPGYDYVVLLQPTSPLRTAADIDAAFRFMKTNNAPACVSVTQVDQSPYWMYRLSGENKLIHVIKPLNEFTRRQDLPSIYTLNGAIYIAKVEWLLSSRSFLGEDTVAYLMPRSSSIDIDDAQDFHRFLQIVESPGFER